MCLEILSSAGRRPTGGSKVRFPTATCIIRLFAPRAFAIRLQHELSPSRPPTASISTLRVSCITLRASSAPPLRHFKVPAPITGLLQLLHHAASIPRLYQIQSTCDRTRLDDHLVQVLHELLLLIGVGFDDPNLQVDPLRSPVFEVFGR